MDMIIKWIYVSPHLVFHEYGFPFLTLKKSYLRVELDQTIQIVHFVHLPTSKPAYNVFDQSSL